MMELRKREKDDHQETDISVNNPTNDATFRKLTAVYRLVRRESKSAEELTEHFMNSSDQCGLIIGSKYKQHPSATNYCTLLQMACIN
jgi:hypothetical protein